jgi:hypothetical protein
LVATTRVALAEAGHGDDSFVSVSHRTACKASAASLGPVPAGSRRQEDRLAREVEDATDARHHLVAASMKARPRAAIRRSRLRR